MYKNIILVVFVFFLIVVILLLYSRLVTHAFYVRHQLLSSNKIKKVHYVLRPMLKDISTSFKKHNLNDWWLDGGSLLGHVRHNGFIPHDDDIDIAMLSNTENDSKLKLCTDELSSKYTIQNTISCINIIDPMTNAAVDIFSYTDNGKELKPNLVSLLQWPNAFYIKDKTFPLKHVLFEGSDVHIPSDPITYCYQMYGKDALTTYKCNHLHKTTTFWEEICIYVVKDIPILITQP